VGDVDVIWFDECCADPTTDRQIESQLQQKSPSFHWSVKNQARMHHRNTDPPYRSVAHAMQAWPETATAVALRLIRSNRLDICSPYGLCDLFDLVLRPTPTFEGERRAIFDQRVIAKAWFTRYPLLNIA
jgi:hypothetical protein